MQQYPYCAAKHRIGPDVHRGETGQWQGDEDREGGAEQCHREGFEHRAVEVVHDGEVGRKHPREQVVDMRRSLDKLRHVEARLPSRPQRRAGDDNGNEQQVKPSPPA